MYVQITSEMSKNEKCQEYRLKTSLEDETPLMSANQSSLNLAFSTSHLHSASKSARMFH